mmetsp:Transcript_6862/g.27562  ORF Transcript_6862/g.27562 Transcript_6862/m.27562 type:complete len:94 (-) Transcript_6862:320-601(-)
MRRSDSLTHIEHAMSSVKSLRGRGLDLPNTPRWLRRKHRTILCVMVIAVVSAAVMVARSRSERARLELDAVASAVTREARRAGKGVLGLRRRR